MQGTHMGNDNSRSNIISLKGRDGRGSDDANQDFNVENVSDFMVDMLDILMRMAAKKDQKMLVYFLDMARIEAREMKNGDEDGSPNN